MSFRLGTIYDPLRNRGVPALPFIYIGFVKANADAQCMGRLSVWIPEMGGDPADPSSWIIASYATPFAGASDLTRIDGYTTNTTVAQQSYGLWLVPPDLNNEVGVFFANGDVSRAYWFCCTYQQNMNHMVPGIAVDVTTQPSPPVHIAPTIEYNKSDKTQNVNAPRRPPFQPLTDGLNTEGLTNDVERGQASTSARREAPSAVFGLLTPRGNSMHIDDNPQNEFIRLRTRSGTQVLIDETTGMVYINSKNGNAWVEVSDAGVDVYSSNSISMRAQGDVNIRADRNILFDAAESISMRAGQDITLEAGRNMEVKVANDLLIGVGHDIQIGTANNLVISTGNDGTLKLGNDFNVVSAATLRLQSDMDTHINSKSRLRLVSTSDTSLKAGGIQYRDGASIEDQSGAAPGVEAAEANAATPPTTPAGSSFLDTSPRMSGGAWIWNAIGATINAVVSRLPTHEPWKQHPSSAVPAPPLTQVPINYEPTYGVGSSSNNGVTTTFTGPSGGTGGTTSTTNVPITGDANDPGCSFGAANTKPCSTEVYNCITAAASKTGANLPTMMAFADIESSFQPGAGATSSSATGLYQFTNGTWNAMVTKYGSEYNVSANAINDPASNALMGGQFLQDNAAILKAKGITANPTAGQLYIMHFMGSGGGPALISAAQTNPSADASSMFPAAAGANPSIFRGQTVGQVYSKLTSMADSKAAAYANQVGQPAPCNRSSGTAAVAPPGSNVPSGGNPVLPSNFEQYKGTRVGNPGWCVQLLQQVGGLPQTAKWIPGNPPTADTPVGTPLATFQNGRYTNDTTGLSHAGFFAGMNPNGAGFYMVDQWPASVSKGADKGLVATRAYTYGNGPGIQNANNYRVINL